jgi:hypothetical protein
LRHEYAPFAAVAEMGDVGSAHNAHLKATKIEKQSVSDL